MSDNLIVARGEQNSLEIHFQGIFFSNQAVIYCSQALVESHHAVIASGSHRHREFIELVFMNQLVGKQIERKM